MKLKTTFLSALFSASILSCLAQEPAAEIAASTGVAADVLPGSMPAGQVLEQLSLSDAGLPESVAYLETHQRQKGGDPLNVIVAAGLEKLTVPSLELRNITTTEALKVISTLLDLELQPVPGDDGQKVAAWLLRRPAAARTQPLPPGAAMGPSGEAASVPILPGAVPAPGVIEGKSEPSTPGLGGGIPNVSIVEVGGGHGAAASNDGSLAAAPRSVKVFGIASLLPPPSDNEERIKLRLTRMLELLNNLQRFAGGFDSAAEVRHYPDLNLIVVKSTALPVITEAIEAMKQDAAATLTAQSSGNPRDHSVRQLNHPQESEAPAISPEKAADH